jgi:hypothetical protein
MAHIYCATLSSPIILSTLASSASKNGTKLSTVPKSSPIRAMISLTRLVAVPRNTKGQFVSEWCLKQYATT